MMQAEMTEAAARDQGLEPERKLPLARRLVGGVRTRILASYVILLVVAGLVSVFAVRQVLLVRLDDRIQEDLQQEVEEFRELAGGIDPRTGEPFGDDVKAIFTTYLQRNVPDDDEELITVPRSGPARIDRGDNASGFSFADFIDGWRRLAQVERAEIDTPAGPVRYVALPVQFGGRGLGTFAVASFVADERREVDEAVRIVAIVAGCVLVLGSVIAFMAAGRVLSPLRELSDAARSVSSTQLDRRIHVESDDEIAQLARTFNRMMDRLESAFASQRDFIRDVSHELRTPIAVVRGHLELLAEMEPGNRTERDASIRLVTGELDRMNRFVQDLLLLAKSDQPNFLQLETVRLADLCEELVEKASGLAEREWALEVSNRRSIVADPQRLTQAAMNLTRNAVAHTDEGDTIEIGASVDGHQASLWVRDTGVGVQPEDERRIFDRFSRGRRSDDRYEGSGLGLAIVRAIAEAHGGRVRVRSRPGEGATFTVTVPVEGPAAREPERHDENEESVT
jgi:signal transduction histidine kinase